MKMYLRKSNAESIYPILFQKTSGTGLEYDDLRHEIDVWQRSYLDVDSLIRHETTRAVDRKARFGFKN